MVNRRVGNVGRKKVGMKKDMSSAVLRLKKGGKVKKKKSKKKSGSTPTNPTLYARVKAEAKRKFDVYPSANFLSAFITYSNCHLAPPPSSSLS